MVKRNVWCSCCGRKSTTTTNEKVYLCRKCREADIEVIDSKITKIKELIRRMLKV
jgi:Zn finger protein HypA/HybF involved in hydrogenase expression